MRSARAGSVQVMLAHSPHPSPREALQPWPDARPRDRASCPVLPQLLRNGAATAAGQCRSSRRGWRGPSLACLAHWGRSELPSSRCAARGAGAPLASGGYAALAASPTPRYAAARRSAAADRQDLKEPSTRSRVDLPKHAPGSTGRHTPNPHPRASQVPDELQKHRFPSEDRTGIPLWYHLPP